MDVRPLAPGDFASWDAFAERHPDGSINHSTRYAQTLGEWGHEFEVVAARESGEYAAGVLINSRPLPVTGWRSANVEGGVLLRAPDAGLLERFIEGLLEYLASGSYVDLRVYMRVPRRINETTIDANVRLGEVLERHGGHRDESLIGTYVVSLQRDNERLVESFSKNCRRDVRKAEREGVLVKESDDRELVPMFYEQYADTYHRKGLTVPLRTPFIRGHERALSAGLMRLYCAEFAGRIVNMAMVSRFGLPRYMKGASIVSTLDERCPPTGQFLHYEIMRRLRQDGYSTYDLGGTPGPSPVEGHPNYSVWRFKHGFGGDYWQDLGEYSFVLDSMRHRVLTLARGVHERITHLRGTLKA